MRNVKIRWISMISVTKQVMLMYMPLIAKMVEQCIFMAAKVNFELICDVNLLIPPSCMLPMLETIHGVIKFTWKRDIFVCDYFVAIKICHR